MPIYVQNIIQNQNSWVTVSLETSLDKAFALMIEHEYSQLPVVDQDMKALGLVTSESITRALLNLGTSLKDLCVRDAFQRLPFHQSDEYLLDLLDSLNDSAVLVVDNSGTLIGIITVHDTNQFFRERAEDTVRIQDIEEALKSHIRVAYKSKYEDSEELQKAIASLGSSQSNHRKNCYDAIKVFCKKNKIDAQHEAILAAVDIKFPLENENVSLSDLTLYDYIQLGRSAWKELSPTFSISLTAWAEMMNAVREIRNKIMHFKGDVTPMERDRLRYCADWYTEHPPIATEDSGTDVISSPKPDDPSQRAGDTNANFEVFISHSSESSIEVKYAPFAAFLRTQAKNNSTAVIMTFSSIEGIIGQSLPKAAKEHSAWWTDDSALLRLFLAAGWRPTNIILQKKQVIFLPSVNREVVKLDEPWEVNFWAFYFTCSESQIREAWEKVGPSARAIKAYLDSPEQRAIRGN